jgi:hypothetical protein
MILVGRREQHPVKFNLRSYQARNGSIPELCVEGIQNLDLAVDSYK